MKARDVLKHNSVGYNPELVELALNSFGMDGDFEVTNKRGGGATMISLMTQFIKFVGNEELTTYRFVKYPMQKRYSDKNMVVTYDSYQQMGREFRIMAEAMSKLPLLHKFSIVKFIITKE